MVDSQKVQAYWIIAIYAIVGFIFLVAINTPIAIPCLPRLFLGIPCPACGLTRAFILASRFDFMGAATMSLLFLPLAIGGAVYFVCALTDLFTARNAVMRFNYALRKKWVGIVACVFILVSWGYNIVRYA